MRKNPVIPYAMIAVIGILTVIVLSFIGVNQRDQLAEGEHGEATQNEEGETTTDPEAIYETNCAMCHGGDLTGGMGPDLTQVGAELSADEISNIIVNGQGDMPAQGHLSEGEVSSLVEWLSEKQ
ncbi:c-type cytochrome [Ornithinibacillus sp. L9]|uniref:C-type cytochrome n=1 Tax=Ornithinibacillus caprae TaxID=2678566 RepID=A0A6N8FFS6_9BACI|nr:cytochrome c [Ornithinibacillus caprae]MUK87104.1 c-type cytochrome [Ornithinibacillus caprae]